MHLNFGAFSLNTDERVLSGPTGFLELSGRSVDILEVLLERPNELVSKSDLLDAVWPGVAVEENALHVHISALRKAIGAPLIVTVHGRGYRYVGPEPKRIESASHGARRRIGNLMGFGVECVGRDIETEELRGLVDKHRLVTVLGAGGVGKTTLCLHLAGQMRSTFEDRVWIVDLASLADGTLVDTAVGQAVGIQVRAEGTPLRAISDVLRPLTGLLVLDNCEHVVQAAARLARSLLSEAPGLKVLTTSQVPLGLTGERLFKLMPFEVSEEGSSLGAAEAFLVHCYEVQGEQVTDAELPLLSQLCRRLDGVALALKMAAARAATLSLKEVDRQLASQLASLSGSTDSDRRHQSLAASLAWSYELLSPDDQRVLRALGAFQGSFTLEGVRAVGGPKADDTLSELVRRSLVVRSTSDRTRYRLLETTRQFALKAMAEAGEESGVRDRLAQHITERFAYSLATWESVPDEQWVATYEPDIDNLRAAHEWAKSQANWPLYVKLAADSYRFWIEAQLPGEGLEFVESATAFVDDVDVGLKGPLYLAVAELARVNALDSRSLEAVEIAEAELERVGHPALPNALVLRGALLNFQGRRKDAAVALQRLEILSRSMVPSKLLAWTLVSLGLFTWAERDRASGLAKVRAGLVMHAQCGNFRGLFRSALYFGEFLHRGGDTEESIRLAHEVLPQLREHGSPLELGAQISNYACYQMSRDAADLARPAIAEAWRLLPRDHATWYWCILQNATELLSLDGQSEDAALLLGFVDACFEAWPDGRQPTEAMQRARIEKRVTASLSWQSYQQLLNRGRTMAPFEAELTARLEASARSTKTVGGTLLSVRRPVAR